MKSVAQDSGLKTQNSRLKIKLWKSFFPVSVLRFAFWLCVFPILLCLVLVLSVPGVMAEVLPLRVFNAEGEEIASLEVLESQEVKYVLLGEVSKLFSGTRKSEPLIGRTTVTMMGKRIVLTRGRPQVKIDGEEYVLSDPPASVSGREAIPLEFLTGILPVIIGKQIALDREDWVLQISREPFVRKDGAEVDSHVPPGSAAPGFRVIIDPGHGGYDMGARSKAGLLEKDLTFAIAQRMKTLLAARKGVDVHLTRAANTYMTTAERVNFANKLRGHIYLSIHFNWSPSPRPRGFGIYVNSNRMRLGKSSDLGADMFSRAKPAAGQLSEVKRFLPQSKRLAGEIMNRLKGMGLTGEQEKEAFLAVMDNLSMPGVLVEVLYLSNPQDLIILSRPDFIDSVSQALCDSVLALKADLEL